MNRSTIAVVGSVNIDLVMTIDPATVVPRYALGTTFRTQVGGKALNCALSLAALDPDRVHFIGRVGADMYGDLVEKTLANSALHHFQLRPDPKEHTGIGHVRALPDGEYETAVLPGANAKLGPDDVIEYLVDHPEIDVWLTNLETPFDWWDALAHQSDHRALYVNLSPVNFDATRALSAASLSVVNELEARLITEQPDTTPIESLLDQLASLTQGEVVITAGERGAWGVNIEGTVHHVPAQSATAVSTIGAGDAFFAGLARVRATGAPLQEAMEWGAQAGALVVASTENFLLPHQVAAMATAGSLADNSQEKVRQ